MNAQHLQDFPGDKTNLITVSLVLLLLTLMAGCSERQAQEEHDQSWVFESQRPEICPEYWIDDRVQFEGQSTFAISGGGKEYSNGCWTHIFDMTPQKYYSFTTYFKHERVDEPDRCVLAKIQWLTSGNQQIGQKEYPRTLAFQGWNKIQQTYLVPDNCTRAKVELVYRWDGDGAVYFSPPLFEEVPVLESRIVRLATVHFRPKNTRSSRENLDLFSGYIDSAALKKADIVCLPEAITMVGTSKTYVEVSEPVPGPSTELLGALAKKHGMYIVAGIFEREGEIVYNTAILLDRNGALAGKYRKVSLPREEIEGGITPGDSYPVFDVDFGRIGLMICWDITFPEAARTLAMKGAEVILMPIAGGHIELARARAIENQIYLVSSSYDMVSGVFGLEGELLVEATEEGTVVVVEVDLNEQKLWPWLGDFKNRISREMPGRTAVRY